MDKAVHKTVRVRAGHRCEYCRFPEAFAELPFHLDHVIAQQHGDPPYWRTWLSRAATATATKGLISRGSTRTPVRLFRCFIHGGSRGMSISVGMALDFSPRRLPVAQRSINEINDSQYVLNQPSTRRRR
jgi:hypothetical protein